MHDIELLLQKAEALRGAVLQARSIESVESQLRDFLSDTELLGISRTHEHVWFRARRCSSVNRYDSLSEMIYPAAGSKDYGRAQYPGSRVLYASWNLPTALEEIGATAGETIQVIRMRVRQGLELPCHVVGELQFFHAAGRTQLRTGPAESIIQSLYESDPISFAKRVFIDCVLSELFRARVKRSYEYKITAAFSEILHKGNGGLMYPSVESLGALNIALPANVFDTVFEVIDTEVLTVTNYVGYSLYQSETLFASSAFASDGTIDWSNGALTPKYRGPYGGWQFDPAHVGWRKA